MKKEAPIHVSNLMLIDPSTDKPTRVGFKVLGGWNQSPRRPPFGRADRPLKERERRWPPRLHEQYETVIRKALQEQFNYTNPMQVPRLDKIVINMGVGEAAQDPRRSRARWPT